MISSGFTLVYSLKDFASDEELKEKDIYRYARKICTVIGFYLTKVHNIELLYMKAHFLKDEHNTLYLQHASETTVRKNRVKIEEKEMAERMDIFNLRTRNIVEKELEEFSSTVHSESVEAIYKLMRKNYQCIKRKAGLIETEIEDNDRLEVDEAFKILRPSSPYKLSEMLHPSFNPKRKLDLLKKNGLSVRKDLEESILSGTPDDVKNHILYNSIRSFKTERRTSIRPATRQDQFSYHRSLLQMKKRMQSRPENNASLMNLRNDSAAFSYGGGFSYSNNRSNLSKKYLPYNNRSKSLSRTKISFV